MSIVFISWSGEKSKLIAEELRKWIPSVLQFAKPYFTPNDIEKGAKWGGEISETLARSNVGIVCLTKENLNKPWILFEAGALSKDLEQSRVCSVLFGMENTDITGPLSTFQTTQFEAADFKKMMWSINETGNEAALSRETFELVFEKWWPELHGRIQAILDDENKENEFEIRTERELLEEILILSRSLNVKRNPMPERLVSSVFIEEFLNSLNKILVIYGKDYGKPLNQPLENLIRLVSYLIESDPSLQKSFHEKISSLKERYDDVIPF